MATPFSFGQPDTRLLPAGSTSFVDTHPVELSRANPALLFSAFKFNTIGQPPDLLKRISTPDPESAPYRNSASRSPTSSPDLEQQLLPLDESPLNSDRPRSRPSLLEVLAGSSSVDNPDAEMSEAVSMNSDRLANLRDPGPTHMAQELHSDATAHPLPEQRMLAISQTPIASNIHAPILSNGPNMPGSAGSASFHSQPPAANPHLPQANPPRNPEIATQSQPSVIMPSPTSAVLHPVVVAKECLEYLPQLPSQHPDQSIDTDYKALRELWERISSSLSNLNTPNISEALQIARSANAQCEAVLTAAQRAHTLAQQSVSTAQESLASSQECLENAEQANVRASEAIAAVEKIGTGRGEGQQGGLEWSQIISGIRGDLHTLGVWVERREAEDARKHEHEKRQEKERQRRSAEAVSNVQTSGSAFAAPSRHSPIVAGETQPISELEADAATRAWIEQREIAEKERIARENAQRLREQEEALTEASRRQEEMLTASKTQLFKLHFERLRAEEEELKQRNLQEQRRLDIEKLRAEAERKKADELEKARKEEATHEAEASAEKKRAFEAREAELRQEQDRRRQQIMEEKQRANTQAAEEIRTNRAKDLEAAKGGNSQVSSNSKTPPGMQIVAKAPVAASLASMKVAAPAQFGNVTSTKTLTSNSPERQKPTPRAVSGGVKPRVGNNNAPETLPAKPPVNAAVSPKSLPSFVPLPKRTASAAHPAVSLPPIPIPDASSHGNQSPVQTPTPEKPLPGRAVNGGTSEILINIWQGQAKVSPRTIYAEGDRHIAGAIKPPQLTVETPEPISTPPVHLPEDSLSAPMQVTPMNERRRISVHRRGPDGGNIPVVPPSRLGVVSPEAQAANLRFVMSNKESEDKGYRRVKHEPSPDNVPLPLSSFQASEDANAVVPPKAKKARQLIEKGRKAEADLPKVESPIDAPPLSLPLKPTLPTQQLASTDSARQKFPDFKMSAADSAPTSPIVPMDIDRNVPSLSTSAPPNLPSLNTQQSRANETIIANHPRFHESSPPRMGPDLATGGGGWQAAVEESIPGWKTPEQPPQLLEGVDENEGRRRHGNDTDNFNHGGAPMNRGDPSRGRGGARSGGHYLSPSPGLATPQAGWLESANYPPQHERNLNPQPHQYPSPEWNARPLRADTPPLAGRKRHRDTELSPPPMRRQRIDDADRVGNIWTQYEMDRRYYEAQRRTPEVYLERSRPPSPDLRSRLGHSRGIDAHNIGRGHGYRTVTNRYLPQRESFRAPPNNYYPQSPAEQQWRPEYDPNVASTSRAPQHQPQNQYRSSPPQTQVNRTNDSHIELKDRLSDRKNSTPPPGHLGKNASRQRGGVRGGGIRGGGKPRGGGRSGNTPSLEQRLNLGSQVSLADRIDNNS